MEKNNKRPLQKICSWIKKRYSSEGILLLIHRSSKARLWSLLRNKIRSPKETSSDRNICSFKVGPHFPILLQFLGIEKALFFDSPGQCAMSIFFCLKSTKFWPRPNPTNFKLQKKLFSDKITYLFKEATILAFHQNRAYFKLFSLTYR